MGTNGLRNLLLAAACFLACATTVPARAEDAWRTEFDATCSRTDEAMTLSEKELLELTATCDRLEKIIAGLPETERKVFLRRLQMCRNLYLFVLETKRNEQAVK